MDLSVYSYPKLAKEKRERQPNWTEPEKQLLLSLTRMHQSILENKGSDTMTIKRKSEAWDDIALNMKAAGYNRSKERLKQQLGRIRAAEAKRQRDELEKNAILTDSPNNNANILCSNIAQVNSCVSTTGTNDLGVGYIKSASTTAAVVPMPLKDNVQIKVEKSSINQDDDAESLIQNDGPSPPSICSSSIRKSLDYETTDGEATAQVLNNTQNENSILEMGNRFCSSDSSSTSTAALDSTTTTTAAAATEKISLWFPKIPSTRQQRLYQLHKYRLAVEKERLRTLKIQQKRERILYRKDIQIQKLKLQILQNLTNQNGDNNRINF